MTKIEWTNETWNPVIGCSPIGAGYEVLAWRATAPNDCVDVAYPDGVVEQVKIGKWRPSIHMPRWASRLTLDVTGVRIERLCDISLDDIHAEGLRPTDEPPDRCDPWATFAESWDHIYATKGLGWDANPWVWVIEFWRKPEKPEKPEKQE